MDTAPPQIRVSREWLQLLDKLPHDRGRILVVGPSDSGKTTLCRWLVNKLRERGTTAWVDADVGQSQIGPPACIGWRLAGATDYRFYFVGDVTPATNPLAAASGTVRMVQEAERSGAGLVVVDTTGYVQGLGGLALKAAKLELLAPLHLVAVGDSPAVKRLLAAWHKDSRLTVHRLPEALTLRQRSAAERMRWRQECFAKYFAACDLYEMPLAGKALSNLPTATELAERGQDWQSLGGLLLGFHDSERHGVALGLIQRLDLREQKLVARTMASATEAAGIIFGNLRLRADGSTIT